MLPRRYEFRSCVVLRPASPYLSILHAYKCKTLFSTAERDPDTRPCICRGLVPLCRPPSCAATGFFLRVSAPPSGGPTEAVTFTSSQYPRRSPPQSPPVASALPREDLPPCPPPPPRHDSTTQMSSDVYGARTLANKCFTESAVCEQHSMTHRQATQIHATGVKSKSSHLYTLLLSRVMS